MEDVELITIPGHWSFDYTYFAGRAASRFFAELRENKRIMGVRCPRCTRVLVPARAFCDACFERTQGWVEVGPGGAVETFTILTAKFPGLPDPPVAMAYVTLDGADTALINVITGLTIEDVDEAAALLQGQPRVTTQFVDDPVGRITDFSFALAQG
jgi:uncharacterized OB-fold protein